MKNIYKHLLYSLERRADRGAYTPSSEFIASNSGVCLLFLFASILFPDISIQSIKYHRSTLYRASSLYEFSNTVYVMHDASFFLSLLLHVIHTIREQRAAKKKKVTEQRKTKSGASTAETVRLVCIHDILSGANERRRTTPRARSLCKTSNVCFLRITRDSFFLSYHADDRIRETKTANK